MSEAESGTAGATTQRRRQLQRAMHAVFDYEQSLSSRLVDGLLALRGIRVLGVTAHEGLSRRVPTVSFVHDRLSPATLAEGLGRRNIFVWSGHNYAVEAAGRLGVLDRGGVLRVGPVHYNTGAEIDAFLNALEDLLPVAVAAGPDWQPA